MATSSTSTSVVFIEPLNPRSSAAVHNDFRVVRFDNQCVLIPESSGLSRRHPRVVTKSYSLPLWKRRTATTTASDSENTDDISTGAVAPPISSSPEETHVVIKVPIPSFVRRPSRSPSGAHGRSTPTSPKIPLSPCLVHRAPSSPSPSSYPTVTSPISPTRRTSLPIYHRRPDDQTVPLRACCPDCIRITEESLEKGSTWQEKFTKGARRRRSASLDSSTNMSPSNGLMSGINSDINVVGAKAAFVPGSFDERMPPPTFAITVDEVDKRRRSQDSTIRSVSPSNSNYHHHNWGFIGSSSSPPGPIKTRDRDHSAPTPDSFLLQSEEDPLDQDLLANNNSATTTAAAVLGIVPPKRKASPIAEEDENELFPLPSPRRSPSSSRTPSSSGSSPKVSPRTSPGVSPAPSPNGSASCLYPSSASVSAAALRAKSKVTTTSKDGGGSGSSGARLGSSSSEEVLGSAGISRKESVSAAGGVIVDLTPPQSGTSTPRVTKPRPTSLTLTFPIPHKSTFNPNSNNANGGDTAPNSPTTLLSSSFNSVSSSSVLSSSSSSAGQPKSPITPTSPRAPSLAGAGGGGKGGTGARKLSFTLPFLKATEAIKGAGVDVLKGVSSISSGGSMMGGGGGAAV